MLLFHEMSKENGEPKGRSLLLITVDRHHVALRALHTSEADIFLHTEYHSVKTDLAKRIWTGEFNINSHISTKHPSLPCTLKCISQDSFAQEN